MLRIKRKIKKKKMIRAALSKLCNAMHALAYIKDISGDDSTQIYKNVEDLKLKVALTFWEIVVNSQSQQKTVLVQAINEANILDHWVKILHLFGQIPCGEIY